MGARIFEIPRTDEMLETLCRVVASMKTDDDDLFETAVRTFWQQFLADCDARGLCHELSPLEALVVLEGGLLNDRTLHTFVRVDFAAAVAASREFIVWANQQQARLN